MTIWTGPNDAPLSTKQERMAKLQQQLKGRPMINADELQKIAQLFQRHTFEQSRGNPRFIVRSNGVIEAFTYADADTLQKALELFPAIVARVEALELENNMLAAANEAAGKIEYLLRQRLQDVRMYLLAEADKHTPRDPILGEAYQMTQRHLEWTPAATKGE